MGVPKFFRYISERYPCLSEVVREYQIPEFDNLYLDMNGIIHMCSHPDDGDPHFRITEERIFQDIFHYIEVLFCMIKPQKLFFMAVDGVAPRAKMNQQRGRRFNAAKDAQAMEDAAVKRGEVLPSQARFDSNCITPGTVFMSRLHEQLKYFVVHKISTDKLWSKCKVILSGHETPGEGEHKIMDYIRYMRAQPGYDPHTRHCLYGLDADLIMLGLCTHEPHFSLLREEIKFGKKSTKRKCVPEEITFFLLHLSLMREYLELEFFSVKEKLPFKFDLENIIDDWVLMGFLVGNDFIPHLPNLHINSGALPLLYNTYMKVLPTLGGYINEAGILNLERFEKFMETLASVDIDNFTEQYADLKYFEAKTGRRFNETGRNSTKTEDLDLEGIETDETVAESDVPAKWDCEDLFDGETSSSDDELFNQEFKLHKRDYYMNKLEYNQVTKEVLKDQAEGYVKAIQWNLHYYYNGCCSWSWYYPHHYAPYISDIKGFSNLKIEFELGQPFKPYEQLLAVLPSASKALLPSCYHDLMTSDDSPIRKYYPEDFKKDLNGKKQDWEAVVLVPFIDEKLLLNVMEPYNRRLSLDEIKRNTHGPMLVYTYTDDDLGIYTAPEYYPPVKSNHAKLQPLTIEEIRIPQEQLLKGLYPGINLDTFYPGFPTMKHLKYIGVPEKARVKVFEQPSRGDSIVVKVEPRVIEDDFVEKFVGHTVYVAWPHLIEALVVGVSDARYRYISGDVPGQYEVEENKGSLKSQWKSEIEGITEHYKSRLGIDVGNTDVLIHVKILTGRKYIFTASGRATLEKQWAFVPSCYPIQVVLKDILVYVKFDLKFQDISNIFPVGSRCFMLGHPHYGSIGEVLNNEEVQQKGRLKVSMRVVEEPDFSSLGNADWHLNSKYMPVFVAASKLGISKYVFSKITGVVLVGSKNDQWDSQANKVNVGLNLKFNRKNEEIPGYTRKIGGNWLYSDNAVQLVKDYMQLCPRLFEYLSCCPNADVLFKEDVFPENSDTIIKEIREWLKKQPYCSIERLTCGSSCLDPEIVKKIEEIVDSFQEKETQVKNVIMQIKPRLLYNSELQTGTLLPDPEAKYQIFDRVVNVRAGHTVPVGMRGTVISLQKVSENDEIVDVVFDQKFPGGIALHCSHGRGYRLPKTALINLSHGARVYHEKTGRPGELMATLHAVKNQDLPTKEGPLAINFSNSNKELRRNEENDLIKTTTFQNSAFASWNKQPAPSAFPNPNELARKNDFMPAFNKLALDDRQQGHSSDSNNASTSTNMMTNQPNIPFQQFIAPSKAECSKKKNKQFEAEPETNWRDSMRAEQQQQQKIYIPVKNIFSKEPQYKDHNVVNTEFLKKLLKIGTPEDKKQEVPVKTTPSSPCMQLLSYYQWNRLGCPQYQYCRLSDKLYQAQITLPSGQVVISPPSNSKEEASENAASEALKILSNMSSEKTATRPQDTTVSKMPEWRQRSDAPINPISNSPKKGSSFQGARKQPGKSANPGQSNASMFVPLQAVRQCAVRNNFRSSQGHVNKQSGSTAVKHTEQVCDKNVPVAKKGSTTTETKRERKMRLAANFTNA